MKENFPGYIPLYQGDEEGEYSRKVELFSRNEDGDTWKSRGPFAIPISVTGKKKSGRASHSPSADRSSPRGREVSRNRGLAPGEARRRGNTRGLVVGRGLRRDGSVAGRPTWISSKAPPTRPTRETRISDFENSLSFWAKIN